MGWADDLRRQQRSTQATTGNENDVKDSKASSEEEIAYEEQGYNDEYDKKEDEAGNGRRVQPHTSALRIHEPAAPTPQLSPGLAKDAPRTSIRP